MTPRVPSLTGVMLAWQDEPLLVHAVEAVLASDGLDVEVVLVDNGCTSDAVDVLRRRAGVTVVTPGGNLGFAAGCNLGARHATGAYVAFVNGDAVVAPAALRRLVDAIADPHGRSDGAEVGLATASLRLHEDPDVVNSAGNPVHFTGLSWAGGLGRPASEFAQPGPVASASGAATVARRDRFAELGGFCEPMFAYAEDTDLSLRAWLHGWQVVYVPDAVVTHRYEFSRNPQKFYLLERNRLFMVLTVFGPRLLALVAPVLVALELGILAVSIRDGWWRQKLAGWWWLMRHASLVRRRRREVRSARRVPDSHLAAVLTGALDHGAPGLAVPAPAQALSRGWWAMVRRLA